MEVRTSTRNFLENMNHGVNQFILSIPDVYTHYTSERIIIFPNFKGFRKWKFIDSHVHIPLLLTKISDIEDYTRSKGIHLRRLSLAML